MFTDTVIMREQPLPEKIFRKRLPYFFYFFGFKMKLMSLLGTLMVFTISMPST